MRRDAKVSDVLFGGYKLRGSYFKDGDLAATVYTSGIKFAPAEILALVMATHKDDKLLNSIEEVDDLTASYKTQTEKINLKFKALSEKMDLVSDRQGLVGLNTKEGINISELSAAERAIVDEIENEINDARATRSVLDDSQEELSKLREKLKTDIETGKVKIPDGMIDDKGHVTKEGLEHLRNNSFKKTRFVGKSLAVFSLVELGADAYNVIWHKEGSGLIPGTGIKRAGSHLRDAHGAKPEAPINEN